ncbi:hypothetical protein XI00_06230 [Bradyrhizobium sp. CCBAU 21359]|nr:hypothetical protein [Bradyrhizobium sp. CCBAU 21359]
MLFSPIIQDGYSLTDRHVIEIQFLIHGACPVVAKPPQAPGLENGRPKATSPRWVTLRHTVL